MKEYKVEKITKNKALDNVNNAIHGDIFLVGISTIGIVLCLRLASISIIPFFASFPLSLVHGYLLDHLDLQCKQKKKILNSPDNSPIINIQSPRVLTEKEMQQIVDLHESQLNNNDNIEETRSFKK